MSPPESRSKISFSIEPLPPLEGLATSWTRLDAVGQHSFFLTWDWIGTWLRSLPSPPDTRLLRVIRNDETVGLSVVTFSRPRRAASVRQLWLNATGDPAYDCITVEHNGFASAGVSSTDLWSAFGDWFDFGASATDVFMLSGIDAREAIFSSQQPIVERHEQGYLAPLAQISTLESFMRSLSGNSRQQLRRSIRAYERAGPLSIEIARDSHTALAFFTQMKLLHVRSWSRRRRRHAFDNPFFETFHRYLIRCGAADGSVEMVRISAGDQVLGYLYNFVRNGTVSNYQTGFDDSDKLLRPGYVCHALAIADYGARGMSRYDFLGGTNRLKESFGPERYELRWGHLRKKKPFFDRV